MKRGFVTTRRIPVEDFLSGLRPTAAPVARGRVNKKGSDRPTCVGKKEGETQRRDGRRAEEKTDGGALLLSGSFLQRFYRRLFLILEPVSK